MITLVPCPNTQPLFHVRAIASAEIDQTKDFGTIEAANAAAVVKRFNVQNSFPSALTIIKLQPSCGCTAAILTNKAKLPVTLLPGSSLSITVTIDFNHLTPGAIDKSVSVYAQGYKDPIAVLHVTGTILPPVSFLPMTLDFGKTAYSQSVSTPLSLSYDDTIAPTDGQIELISKDPRFVVQAAGTPRPPLAPPPSGGEPDSGFGPPRGGGHGGDPKHTYTIQLSPGHSIGNISGKLIAVMHPATGADIELGEIPCYADVQGDIDAVPRVIAFGQALPSKPAIQTFLTEGKKLEKLTATSPAPYLSVALGSITHASGLNRPFGAPMPMPTGTETETVEATVTLSPSAPAGPLQTTVLVTSTDGEQLSLPVYAIVGTSK